MKNDQELMKAYYEGKQEAMEELFSRYKKKIFNYCLRFLHNQADAEDAAAEVFYAVSAKKETYRSYAQFSTWIYTIARNACINRWRKRKRFVFLWFKGNDGSFKAWDVADEKVSADLAARCQETSFYVKKALQRLPLSYREVVLLREYQQLSYAEISEVLGISTEKVKAQLFRARQKLKQYLQPILSEAGNV